VKRKPRPVGRGFAFSTHHSQHLQGETNPRAPRKTIAPIERHSIDSPAARIGAAFFSISFGI